MKEVKFFNIPELYYFHFFNNNIDEKTHKTQSLLIPKYSFDFCFSIRINYLFLFFVHQVEKQKTFVHFMYKACKTKTR